jgi:hypothetical protein
MTETIIHKQVDDNKDSLELSTPAKGGAIKIYGDFNDEVTFLKKISNAISIRKQANELLKQNEE